MVCHPPADAEGSVLFDRGGTEARGQRTNALQATYRDAARSHYSPSAPIGDPQLRPTDAPTGLPAARSCHFFGWAVSLDTLASVTGWPLDGAVKVSVHLL